MANPVPPRNGDNSLRSYTAAEVALMQIEHVGVEDGAHPTHQRTPGECTITRSFYCAFAELESFLCYMVGANVVYTNGSGDLTLSRLLPQQYPGKSNIRAVKMDRATGFQFTNPYLDANDVPTYAKWLCEFTYQHCPFLLAADGEASYEYQRYLIELPSTAAADYITLPGGVLKFQKEGGGGPSGTPIPYNVGFVVPAVTIKKKWIKVPYDGWKQGSQLRARVFGDLENAVEPYLGTINNATIFGYAPGQLLLTGVEDALELDPLGDDLHWNLTFTWLARSVSHNWFKYFDPAGTNTGWYFVSNNGTYYDTSALPDGKSLFNPRNHVNLFAVGNEY